MGRGKSRDSPEAIDLRASAAGDRMANHYALGLDIPAKIERSLLTFRALGISLPCVFENAWEELSKDLARWSQGKQLCEQHFC